MIKLYSSPGACSLASHIALREAGAAFDLVRVDFKTNQQRQPDYLAINSKGRVPALALDAGVLTETPAILGWIAAAHPDAGLAPADPWDRARMDSLMAFLCATLHVAHAHKFRGSRWADETSSHEDMRRKVPQTVGAAFRHVEDECMGDGPWAMGDGFSVADPYLYTVARWMEGDDLDLADFPKVAAHRARMETRAPVLAALEAEGLSPLSA
ncbi:MAG: glutathione S-transferase C-terminal domain-containing protein [Pseudomonadota bacterium]|nr:glutathione S-transferase C-terminal domain-containing protein [Pseudomonadota bacterium]